MTTFETLNKINVNEHTEKKNGLTYLSWAWAWAETKKVYPDAVYEVKKFDGKPWLYDENLGYMVMTEMTIDGLTHEMWLPVMDGSNKAMKDEGYTYEVKNPNYKYATLNVNDGKFYDKYGNEQKEYIEKTVKQATMFDINTAIMRCLVKNIAMFGLGLYIYAGEDLPEEERKEEPPQMASEPKIKVLKSICEKNKVSFEKLLASKNRTVDTLTEAEATQLLIGLKKKYGDD